MGKGQRRSVAVRGLWRWFGSRPARLSLVLLLPIIIVIATPFVFGWADAIRQKAQPTQNAGDSAVPPAVQPAPIDKAAVVQNAFEIRREAAHEFSELSKDVSALAAAILAAVIIVLREQNHQQRTRRFINGVMVTVVFAMTSIYSCIRLRYNITLQLWENQLDLSLILRLFITQVLFLIGALSILMLLAASIYTPAKSSRALEPGP